MNEDQFSEAVSRASFSSLNDSAKLIWKAHGAGLLDDQAAERLSIAIEARRSELKDVGSRASVQCFKTRPRPCQTPDRAKSIARRRGLAASGAVPGAIAANFTTGETAVLSVIARQCQRKGFCDWFLDRIAAVAGVSRTTVRNALRQARAAGLISVQERRRNAWRSDSNVVRIVSAEWLIWLGLGGGGKKAKPTNNHLYRTNENPRNYGEGERMFSVRSGIFVTSMVGSSHAKPYSDYRAPLNR